MDKETIKTSQGSQESGYQLLLKRIRENEKMKPQAIKLLSNPLTALKGTEFVLGRRLKDSSVEKKVVLLLALWPDFSSEQRFDFLLIVRDIETAKANSKSDQF